MIKCTILLPLTDNDGFSLAKEGALVLERLYEKFGGYTVEGTVTGTYRMDNGIRAIDTSTKVTVCVKAGQVLDLLAMVAEFGRIMRQETIYFEKALSVVELVKSHKVGPLCAPSAVPEPTQHSFEVFEELPQHIIDTLRRNGCRVHLYAQRGGTASTVIRW